MTRIIIHYSDIKKLKKVAGLAVPHIGTAHRVEVVARFLGWRTYSDLLAHVRSHPATINALDYDAVTDFCKRHDLDLDHHQLARIAEFLLDELDSR